MSDHRHMHVVRPHPTDGPCQWTAADSWTVEVWHLATPILGFSWETRLVRPDGSMVVASRSATEEEAADDMTAAAFAIAAVLDPEHNGPWQEPCPAEEERG